MHLTFFYNFILNYLFPNDISVKSKFLLVFNWDENNFIKITTFIRYEL